MSKDLDLLGMVDDVYYMFKKFGEPGWKVLPLEWMKVRLLIIIAYTLIRIYNELRK